MPLLSKVISELDLLIFEQVDGGMYDCLQVVPEWFIELYNYKLEENRDNESDTSLPYYDLALAFPFLDCFIEEIEENEAIRHQKKYQSGLWTEDTPNHEECNLSAIALYLEDRMFLVIENRTPSFDEQHKVIQKARDIALVNEKVALELHIHQRKLQDLVENLINKNTDISDIGEVLQDKESAIMVCGKNGEPEITNRALTNIYEASNIHELNQHSLLDKWMSEAEKHYPEIKIALKAGAGWEGEFETHDLLGQNKWIRLSITPVFDKNKELRHYICIANNIEKLKITQDSLVADASVDILTKLPNRKQFWKTFTKTLHQCAVSNEQFALLTLDIDYFKHINNEYGYNSGDFLLTVLASRIRACLKNLDYTAHLGGDEFAIILRNVPTPETTHIVANRLFDSIHEPVSLNQKPVQVTASMGAAVYPLHGATEAELMQHAELAMYYAKELGKNQLQIYNHGLTNISFKVERERELAGALENHQLFIEYQPQVSLKNDKTFRLEALLRWHHGELGIIPPDDFIPLAEKSGLIVPIGQWIFEMCCLQIKLFTAQNIPCVIAVNVSPKQLQNPSFAQDLNALCIDYRVEPSKLEIEITESLFEHGLSTAINTLEELRSYGFTISLDDFGAGYSSFNHLKELPVDVLKIDRAFISELETSNESRIITSTIIQLAKALNLTVIAEGVETQRQLDFLQGQECDIVQGFLYYRPMRPDYLSTIYASLQNKNR